MAGYHSGFEYEHQEFSVKRAAAHLYIGFFRELGWELEQADFSVFPVDILTLRFCRPRSSSRNPELTKLQWEFESAVGEIEAIEDSRARGASRVSIAIGLFGALLTIAALVLGLCGSPELALTALSLGLIGCVLALFTYVMILRKETTDTEALTWKKYEDAYLIRKKAADLVQSLREGGANT